MWQRWKIESDSEATELPSTIGTTVTLVGLLDEYTYTDFGLVKNPDNIYLKITVTIGEKKIIDTDTEAVKITTNVNNVVDVELNSNITFNFDKKKVGFLLEDVQQQTFTIENIGDININGLSVRIVDTGGANNVTDFVISKPLSVDTLVTEGKAAFDIRTKRKLPVGEYTAKVVVSSNNSTDLESFIIKFVVTDKNIYKVEVITDDSSIGYGYSFFDGSNEIASSTYEEGETVKLRAIIKDTTYKFKEWTSENNITIVDSLNMETSFTMIDEDIFVEAVFADTPEVWLRLASLIDKNEDDSENQLREMSPPYTQTTFAEAVKAYYVIVDGSTEKNKIEFILKDTDIKDDITITVECNGTAYCDW